MDEIDRLKRELVSTRIDRSQLELECSQKERETLARVWNAIRPHVIEWDTPAHPDHTPEQKHLLNRFREIVESLRELGAVIH